MKKTVSLLLSLIMIISVLVAPVSAETAEQKKLVDYLVNDMVGQSFKSNSCQAFVYQSLNKCFGVKNTKTSCCATQAWKNYGISSSRDNIPLGAAVYFGGSNVTDRTCGQKAGHVGLYVGNGEIVHAWSKKIKKTTIDYVINCGYPYRGWGWQGGRTLTGSSSSATKGEVKKPTINVTSYPKNIKKGSNYGLRGSINANGGSTEVMGYIINSKGKNVQTTKLEKTSSSNFDIRYSNVNEQLSFDKLGAGKYTLKITAKNSKGTTTFEKDFTVEANEAGKKPVKPTIDVTSYPTSIKKGSSYGLRGLINANGGSTEVMGYIINSKGKTVQSTKLEKTSSSKFDIRYANVNEQLLFNKLSKGTYTLKITAKNSAGTTTFSKQFKVK